MDRRIFLASVPAVILTPSLLSGTTFSIVRRSKLDIFLKTLNKEVSYSDFETFSTNWYNVENLLDRPITWQEIYDKPKAIWDELKTILKEHKLILSKIDFTWNVNYCDFKDGLIDDDLENTEIPKIIVFFEKH